MKMDLSFAEDRAAELVEHLRPACHRVKIAGSIRRREPEVGDIEVVCIPKVPTNLLGEPDLSQPHDVARKLEELGIRPRRNSKGRRIAWGQRALIGELEDVPIDVFCVLPPAQWGALFAIRTGPADFSKWLVTRALSRGLRCKDGRLVVENGGESDGSEIPTPTEALFFSALGLDFIPPTERRAP